MIRCKIFGHIPASIDRDDYTAICSRCGVKLNVSYDMCYGETIVLGEVYD